VAEGLVEQFDVMAKRRAIPALRRGAFCLAVSTTAII